MIATTVDVFIMSSIVKVESSSKFIGTLFFGNEAVCHHFVCILAHTRINSLWPVFE